uniref:Uncharacterized protein n=1 Tax=Parascaris equorum TaxID=6256 RepID=A0A914RWA8_PAREQ
MSRYISYHECNIRDIRQQEKNWHTLQALEMCSNISDHT